MNQVGLYGLGVMGQSLVKNLLNHGYTVAVYNRKTSITNEFVEREKNYTGLSAYENVADFINSLEKPRKLMLMVTAGKVVDNVIEQVIPYLSKDDIILECGNTYYKDTERRIKELEEKGIRYLGIGVSGGEKGALEGPSMMVSGNKSAYTETSKMLLSISAKAYDEKPCCAYLGKGGAGHFIKMVHNGVEYAIIQTICEVFDILRKVYGYSVPEISYIFSEMNKGILNSYLVEITEKICSRKDDLSDKYLVEQILDKAGQKGTGKWTCQEGIAMEVAVPTIVEAVSSRIISNNYETRKELSAIYSNENKKVINSDKKVIIDNINSAIYISNLCIYNQAFMLIEKAKIKYGWEFDLGEVTQIWRNGCIIRSSMLDDLYQAVNNDGYCLFKHDKFKEYINDNRHKLNEVVSNAIECQISIPCLSSATTYLNSYTDDDSSASLLQAQRDFFGAHTYERKDREGIFHTIWE